MKKMISLIVFISVGISNFCFSQEMIFEKKQNSKNMRQSFHLDPSITEVHQWAIDYADVNQEKIVNWRKSAQKKAWFPKVTVGVDGDKNRTVSDSIWGSYSSGGQHYLGPDDKSFDSNFAWDASVTWDFADLVWSSDQTSIDVRSRSMVKLREDILEQVTEFYFERRRLQMAILEESSSDAQILSSTSDLQNGEAAYEERSEAENSFGLGVVKQRQLRIDELTALIDALTDGKFSKQVNQYSAQ